MHIDNSANHEKIKVMVVSRGEAFILKGGGCRAQCCAWGRFVKVWKRKTHLLEYQPGSLNAPHIYNGNFGIAVMVVVWALKGELLKTSVR